MQIDSVRKVQKCSFYFAFAYLRVACNQRFLILHLNKFLKNCQMQEELCVQFGCGLSCPEEWLNYDASPTLRIQKIPFLGPIFTKRRVKFPKSVRYGDVLKGLPHNDNSVDKIYCSHVLEHLSFEDFHLAIKEVYRCLRKGGEFRIVMPDLRVYATDYLNSVDSEASNLFMNKSMLGIQKRPVGVLNRLIDSLGNHHHLWLWDAESTAAALQVHGFSDVRNFKFREDEPTMFKFVQERSRFNDAVSISCRK